MRFDLLTDKNKESGYLQKDWCNTIRDYNTRIGIKTIEVSNEEWHKLYSEFPDWYDFCSGVLNYEACALDYYKITAAKMLMKKMGTDECWWIDNDVIFSSPEVKNNRFCNGRTFFLHVPGCVCRYHINDVDKIIANYKFHFHNLMELEAAKNNPFVLWGQFTDYGMAESVNNQTMVKLIPKVGNFLHVYEKLMDKPLSDADERQDTHYFVMSDDPKDFVWKPGNKAFAYTPEVSADCFIDASIKAYEQRLGCKTKVINKEDLTDDMLYTWIVKREIKSIEYID